jgi:AraC family transcriptional regulator, transcriptional activator of the genes for pyochelin and ferripyochelin receptors
LLIGLREMASSGRDADSKVDASVRNVGLFRTILAGSGHTLADAFAKLEQAPEVERMTRHPKRGLLGARVTLPPDEGEGYWDLTRIRDDIYVVVANFTYKDPRVEVVPGDGLVQFNFKLSGDMSLAVSRTEPLRWNRPSLLVWAQPTGIDISEWTAPSARERFIIISIRPEFLAEHFLASADAPQQLQAFVTNKREQIIYTQRPLTSQTFDVTTRLINNPFSGTLGLIYTEALALELLCCAVKSFGALSGAPTEEYTERELKCLHMARNILMKQLAPPPTITQLARAVGMAKSTLTKGFKAVFGETILDFSLSCRMRRAMTLMRDECWSVAKASEAAGYAHPTSFTTAFRRHFGMRPIEVRRVKSRDNPS